VEADRAWSAKPATRSGPSTAGSSRSMHGSRRAATTGTPTMATLPKGPVIPQATTEPNQTALTRNAAQRSGWCAARCRCPAPRGPAANGREQRARQAGHLVPGREHAGDGLTADDSGRSSDHHVHA
jgi:hypothetical protein